MKSLQFALLFGILGFFLGCGDGTGVEKTPENTTLNTSSTGVLKGQVTRQICGGAVPLNPPPGYHPCSVTGLADTIQVTSASGAIVGTYATDTDGNYQVSLPPGSYVVVAQASQSCPSWQECPGKRDISLAAGQQVTGDFQYNIFAP